VVLDRGDGESGFIDHIFGADGRMAPLGRAGHPGDKHKLYQNGREVFKFAVRIIPEMVEKLLSRNGIPLDDVQYIIPHQANARIIQAAARKIDVGEEKIVMNLEHFGNTSAASIPLSYPDIYDELERGRYVITAGFGFGLTWAANLYRI
jgi:3-oxoacyl-[acyl-carrier-protein] synthase III